MKQSSPMIKPVGPKMLQSPTGQGAPYMFPQSERRSIDKAPSGFIQAIPSSKPPQSVASINFSTMMEDSESLIRAYKKKKAELETLRD